MSDTVEDLPIGVFDSGLGGLTVVREIRRLLPRERIVYLGDSARVPYGTRSPQTVMRYAHKCSDFLLSQGLKALVVACNTASAVALDTLIDVSKVPVLGVITAGAKAVAACGVKRVGVIGTAGTVGSGAYLKEIRAVAPQCEVFQAAAPLLVPLAEEGWVDGDVPLLAATRYLTALVKEKIEVLLLGCTHYPLLVSPITRALEQMRPNVVVIDSATAMAADVERMLLNEGILRKSGENGDLTCFVTDLPGSFEEVTTRFLGEPPGETRVVDIS